METSQVCPQLDTESQMAGRRLWSSYGSHQEKDLVEHVYLNRAHRWHCIASLTALWPRQEPLVGDTSHAQIRTSCLVGCIDH